MKGCGIIKRQKGLIGKSAKQKSRLDKVLLFDDSHLIFLKQTQCKHNLVFPLA